MPESQKGDIQWQLWCRLCARDDLSNINLLLKDEQSGLQELTISQTIQKYFGFGVQSEDSLPKMLCTECFSLMTSLVNFADRVERVQQMFHFLNETENKDVDCQALRLQFGIMEMDQEQNLEPQTSLLEVHYVESKPQITTGSQHDDDIAENFFEEEEPNTIYNPLEHRNEETKTETAHDKNNSNSSHSENDNDPELENEVNDNDDEDDKIVLANLKRYVLKNNNLKKIHRQLRSQKIEKKNQKEGKKIKSESLQCAHCPERLFSSKYQLEKHLKVHLPLELKRTVPCPYCDKKFSSSSVVQTHIKYIHNNDRSFICEECGITMRTNAALKAHMLTHTDLAPFECEVCKKGFKNQIRLKNHMEIHDPHKHICAECGLQLNSRATLNRHLLVHSDKMQHKCDYCGRAFKRAKALKNHLILHTGLKPYSCDFCDRTFANGSNCRSHKKKAHPVELAAFEAAGGAKQYTRNIPKLEALKAVTKAADNLAPVVSKQSGRFAFGKKPKPNQLENDKTDIESSNEQNKKHKTNSNFENVNQQNPYASIPVDNLYSHILKQTNDTQKHHHDQQQKETINPSAGILSPEAACIPMPPDVALRQQLVLQHHTQPQILTPSPANTIVMSPSSTNSFVDQTTKLSIQQSSPMIATVTHQQHHHRCLEMQNNLHSVQSPDNQKPHIIDDRSDSNSPSVVPFYSHTRSALPNAAFMQ